MLNTLRFVSRALATIVVVVAGAALVVGVVVPRFAGATTYTVTSASMAPGLPVGSLAVVRPTKHVAIGDVITYQQSSGEARVVTHRVVGVGMNTDGRVAYTTRGDANGVNDAALVRPEQVHGVLWYHVPYLGRLSAMVGTGQRQTVAIGCAALLVGYAAWQLVLTGRERRHAHTSRSPVQDLGRWP
ncbi:MAG: signal peptidase I [Micrococcales bacterium]|nr:signal peptidase I [Micrococcales bacterium]